jgi:hypothetical protein
MNNRPNLKNRGNLPQADPELGCNLEALAKVVGYSALTKTKDSTSIHDPSFFRRLRFPHANGGAVLCSGIFLQGKKK